MRCRSLHPERTSFLIGAEDAGLREKLQGAGDLDAAMTLAQEAGFDVSKADWLKHQAKQTMELSDEELEAVSGGANKGGGGGWRNDPTE